MVSQYSIVVIVLQTKLNLKLYVDITALQPSLSHSSLTSSVVSQPSSSSHSETSLNIVSSFSRSSSVINISPSSSVSLSRVSNRKLSTEFFAWAIAILASSRALKFFNLDYEHKHTYTCIKMSEFWKELLYWICE